MHSAYGWALASVKAEGQFFYAEINITAAACDERIYSSYALR